MSRRLLVAVATTVVLLASAPAARADWTWPVNGEVITPYVNGDDPYAAGQHRGIDIAAAVGTPVVAAAGGEVRFAGMAGSSGLTVSIRTADGRFDTSYLHLSSIGVRKGEELSVGDRLGSVGTTGERSAAAPHLHFGLRDAGSDHGYHDPLAFLPPTPVPAERPRPAPAPHPVPETPSPEPARAPAPAPAPAPAHPRARPLPRESPRPHPPWLPLPGPRGAPAPRVAPRGAPLPQLARSPRLTPLPRLAPLPQLARSPQLTPIRRLAPLPQLAPAPDQLTSPSPTRPAAPPGQSAAPASSAGLDLGYALACAGLLVAAGLLGLSDDRHRAARHATRRSRDRLAAGLRPLLGRR